MMGKIDDYFQGVLILDFSGYCKCCPCWKSNTGEWYLNVWTSKWDDYEDEFVHEQIPIKYCPYTGKELKEDTVCEYNQEQLPNCFKFLLCLLYFWRRNVP